MPLYYSTSLSSVLIMYCIVGIVGNIGWGGGGVGGGGKFGVMDTF